MRNICLLAVFAWCFGLLLKIREAKLEDLLHKHVSWAAEIKNLDSDMQMLVYENYSKFISATDTIRRFVQQVSLRSLDCKPG